MLLIQLFKLSIILLIAFSASAQTELSIIEGYVGQESASFCLMTNKSESLRFELKTDGNTQLVESRVATINEDFCYESNCAVKLMFDALNPGVSYNLALFKDEKVYKSLNFTTKSKKREIKDFTIITGSCSFTPISWRKILFPFLSLKIYKPMQEAGAEFMLWLGDTVYYVNDDTKGRKVRRNILYRYREKLMKFLTSTPQIAMWDDHDFGPNNADGSYAGKEASLAVFNQFWPNPASVDTNGMYFKVSQYDVDFFILDNRSYSTECTIESACILGDQQKSWLKEELRQSEATFKIICSGNQFIADYLSDKTFALYPKERNEILDFLKEEQIEGVFFLTGDRHHTEVLKKEINGLYTLFEYSCSPVTSWPNAKLNSLRFNKKQRIRGTLINKRNFGKLSFKGDSHNRVCIIETLDKNGKLKGKFEIKAEDLRF